jgi:hypothetical protein
MKQLSASERKALARLDLVDPTVLDALVEELRDQSDRSAVIVGAAQLDDLLADLLYRFFLPSIKTVRKRDDDTLLGRDRPLSTFSARITIAYRLGLLGKDFASSLGAIREIRNACAHKVESTDLNRSPHRELVARLGRPIPSPTFWSTLVARFGQDCPSSHFRAVVLVMSQTLLHDIVNVARPAPQSLLGANLRS